MANASAARSAHPDGAPVVQEFLQWYRAEKEKHPSCELDCINKRAFIPLKSIQAYFSPENRSRTEDILRYVLANPEDVECDAIENEYCRVFAILLNEGQGHQITAFLGRSAFNDSKLPFRERPKDFPQSSTCNLWEKFEKRQWELCAVQFGTQKQTYEKDDVLPITEMEAIKGGAGASARTYKIKIHPDGIKLLKAPKNQWFVLKVSLKENREQFDKEEKAMKHMRKKASTKDVPIIEHYATFEKGEYLCSILEHANGGNLEEFFQTQIPPSCKVDILAFWTNLLGLLSGVMLINDHKTHYDGHDIKGYHQDIKPTNILVVNYDREKPFASRFKLADLGMSFFRPLEGSRARPTRGPSTTHPWRSSRTYGPPEHYDPYEEYAKLEHPAYSSSDVWSLGAVFSEAAAWSRGGSQELHSYRYKRVGEIRTDPGERIYHEWAFHKRGEVLQSVQEKHEDLESNGDFVTQLIVREVISRMLYPDPTDRGSAKYFNSTWKDIQKRPRRPRTPDVMADDTIPIQDPPTIEDHPGGHGGPVAPPLINAETRVPQWRWSDAEQWAKDKKQGRPFNKDPLDYRHRKLQKRDHIFVIDDSETMREHWEQVISNLRLLSLVLFHYGADDLIDVYLLINEEHLEITKSTMNATPDYLRRKKPQERGDEGFRQADPRDRLNEILRAQVAKTSQPGWRKPFDRLLHPLRPLSIYVLTDGRWASNKTQKTLLDMLDSYIKDYPRIKDKHSEKDPTLGIQFIRFGDYRPAIQLLDTLDRAQKLRLLKVDLVDTEPWNENVAKMLLGALDEEFDDDETDDESAPQVLHRRVNTQGQRLRPRHEDLNRLGVARASEDTSRPGHTRSRSLRNLVLGRH